ncbi:DUF455 domain-containing protein [Arthroderma uncinatum]|uniref:DUF455 domain-containing protein n=1 Tax=Arthroderma uncinatum TaxID=74035 RepID=UPI00144A922D|nr:DUF455 domain-containing protein [Arthroderma uncinatum]KAF3479625.1 DUF455 domain-containing protein [Arthroderma uncinatum]
MVSTHAPAPDAGNGAGYTKDQNGNQSSAVQHPTGPTESHNQTYPVAQPPQYPSPPAATYDREETIDGATRPPMTNPGHANFQQVPQVNGYENTADIWGERVGNEPQTYSPPILPFSAQVTGQTDPGSFNERTRSESPSGVHLQSNNPFLKAKLNRSESHDAVSNPLDGQLPPSAHDGRNAPLDNQDLPSSSQANTGMAALSLATPINHNSEDTAVGEKAAAPRATPIPDRTASGKELASPTESVNLIDFDSHEPSIDGESRPQINTPSESSLENIDKGKGVALEHTEHHEPHSTDRTETHPVPTIVEPSSTPDPNTNTSEHASHRSEVYDIRIVNWTDGTTELRQSPVLALFDELMSSQDGNEELPDIEALSVFLTMLHTGMNVNPRLTPVLHPPTPGTFLKTRDIELYSAFNLPLVHGWAAAPASPTHEAMLHVAEYHDDIQLLHFQREDLETRAINTGSLTPDEQRLFQDIDTIQRFVTVDNPTQLSPFGLRHLEKSLPSGSVCVLFRNDHFSTLFKHPLSNQLFTLVTDAGYAGHAEIVWESLVDVNGTNSELYSGDFRPVGHGAAESSQTPPRRERGSAPKDTASSTEQTDADYAFALSLQYEDEQNRQEERRPSPPASRSQNNLRANSETMSPRGRTNHQIRNTRSASFTRPNSALPSTLTPLPRTPTTNRPPPSRTQGFSPMVPPSSAQSRNDNDPNAPPPTYEQAAQEPAYIPPPNGPPYQQRPPGPMGPIPPYNQMPRYNHGPGPGPGPNMAARRRQGGASLSTSSLPQRDYYRERDRNKDCIVM